MLQSGFADKPAFFCAYRPFRHESIASRTSLELPTLQWPPALSFSLKSRKVSDRAFVSKSNSSWKSRTISRARKTALRRKDKVQSKMAVRVRRAIISNARKMIISISEKLGHLLFFPCEKSRQKEVSFKQAFKTACQARFACKS